MDMYPTVIFSSTSRESMRKRRTDITTVTLNMMLQVIVMCVRKGSG